LRLRGPSGQCERQAGQQAHEKVFVFHLNHFQKAHQKSDGLDFGSERSKRKRLFGYVFMREKSIKQMGSRLNTNSGAAGASHQQTKD
jgi:hypothetical protein